jgi:hypothetical protein
MFGLSSLQASYLVILLGGGTLFLSFTVNVELINTLLLFFFITGLGLRLCYQTRINLVDPKLRLLGTLWLFKVFITLFLLYAGWMPRLDPGSVNWGYDPQRYFQDARILVEDDWEPVAGTNYQGIIFYYGAIFYLFGYNPVIPALINAFVTLLGTIFLIKCIYEAVLTRTERDWTIAFLLLVPEVLWYDVMTSRETLTAVLIIFSVMSISRYFWGVKQVSFIKMAFTSILALLAILIVRTSIAIPVILSISVMILLVGKRKKWETLAKLIVFGIILAMFFTGELIQQLTGGINIDWLKTFGTIQSFNENVAAKMEWSENSIGLLIAPNNLWQAIIYLPIRMVLYLAAPLPNIVVPFDGLIQGDWFAWQSLMTIPTSIMMMLGLPFVLAAGSQAWRFRLYQPAPLALHITFWVTFVAVAGGNIIIHERYRLMFTLLFFACMWFGYTRCSLREVRWWACVWFGLVVVGAVFYILYKFIA